MILKLSARHVGLQILVLKKLNTALSKSHSNKSSMKSRDNIMNIRKNCPLCNGESRIIDTLNVDQKFEDFIDEYYGDKSFNPSLHSNKREYLEGIENINMEFPMPDIDDFIDHIDYVVDLIGVDYVGISSDFGGGGGISGWIDASETKLLTSKLKERGYSPEEIEKIWGGNILRVWKRVEDIASNT